MITPIMSRKKLLLAAFVLIALVVVIVILTIGKGEDVKIESVKTINDMSDSRIDFTEYENAFTPEEQKLINQAFSTQIEADKEVEAVARNGSYRESIIDNTPVKQLLLDVPAVKKTYLVYRTEGGVNGQNILYVECASKDEQREPDWECVDETE